MTSASANGAARPGSKRLTSHDIAAAVGVSQATVSRVLAGSPAVKESTRETVLRVLRESGYTPHAGARAMRTQRTGVIGVVVAHITNPFYPHLLEALSTAIDAAGHRMILWDGRQDGERSALTAIRERAVDSVIFTSATQGSVTLAESVARGLPVVLVNRTVPGLAYDSVTSDNAAGGRAVARYFFENGRQHVAAIGGQADVSTGLERLRGFLDAFKRAGMPPPKVAHGGEFSYEAGATAMLELLDKGTPDAVFCANDVLAFGAMDAARGAGIRIPCDMRVVGYDDIAMAAWSSYNLTTVRQPVTTMARNAVAFALERLDQHDRPPRRSRLKSDLVLRGSTGRLLAGVLT